MKVADADISTHHVRGAGSYAEFNESFKFNNVAATDVMHFRECRRTGFGSVASVVLGARVAAICCMAVLATALLTAPPACPVPHPLPRQQKEVYDVSSAAS